MIIWIDGVNGVGKSHVAAELEELLFEKNAEYVESDLYWEDFLRNNVSKALSGFNPYCNQYFMEILRKVLEEKMNDYGKISIVPMSLVDKLCDKELFHYFEEKGTAMVHVILEAKKETIMERIEKDPIRDENAQSQQKKKVDWQMKYLKKEYPNAVRINTEGKTIHETAVEVKNFIKGMK